MICTRTHTKIVTETRLWLAYETTAYEDHCTSLNIDLNLITAMPLTVNDIKTVQFLLIVRAGLAVMEGSEKSIEILHSDSLLEFSTAVKNYKLNAVMSEVDKSIFMRTKNFLNPTCKPTDMHTGESIWRKFKDIRRYFAYLVVSSPLGKAWRRLYNLSARISGIRMSKYQHRRIRSIRLRSLILHGIQSSGQLFLPIAYLPTTLQTFLNQRVKRTS
jgi:hypothetical protein